MQEEMLEREKEVLDSDESIAMVSPRVELIDPDSNIIYQMPTLKGDVIYERWEYINQFLLHSKDFIELSTPAILLGDNT